MSDRTGGAGSQGYTESQNHMRWRTVLFTILVVALLGIACGVYVVVWGPNTFRGGEEKTLFVSRGRSFHSIVDSLESKGIIRNRKMFELVARLYGGTDRLQVGKYVFTSGISNLDIYRALRSGKGSQIITATLPEGTSARTQARILAHHLGIDSSRYMRLVRDTSFIRSLGIEASSLEGYLLPDTYGFSWEPSEEDVLRRQIAEFHQFFNDTLKLRASELGWTVHRAVTFASIVEGEAVLAEERPIIAGVYHNRLKVGMKLEADPTIQYIVPDGPRRLLFSDLKFDSPYNTYLYPGLPPGPVNNPGRSSILASLYPVLHGYLYFVANGKGGHWFSRSYDEHVRNVRKYRHERAQRHRNTKGPTLS
jgi:UPF0755 protein